MPTNKTRISRQRVKKAGLSEGAYCYFMAGEGFFDGEDYEKQTTPEQRPADWEKLKGAILERCLQEAKEKGDPGHRPAYFWDHTKEPRLIEGSHKWYSPAPGGFKEVISPIWETDFAYLKRLGLLDPWELRLPDPERRTWTIDLYYREEEFKIKGGEL